MNNAQAVMDAVRSADFASTAIAERIGAPLFMVLGGAIWHIAYAQQKPRLIFKE